jgi:cytochrome c oxidase subunit 1
VVAHFHYVLFGGSLMGIRRNVLLVSQSDRPHAQRAYRQVALLADLLCMNLAFFPMHGVGLDSMPRRVYTYRPAWAGYNLVETVGAFIIAMSVLVFLYGMAWSLRHGRLAGNEPWDGGTLEWSILSPPPHYNFERTPIVSAVDDWWYQKYGPQREPEARGEVPPHERPVMPDPSYFPVVAAAGMLLMALGLLVTTGSLDAGGALITIGWAVLLMDIYGWSLEAGSNLGR